MLISIVRLLLLTLFITSGALSTTTLMANDTTIAILNTTLDTSINVTATESRTNDPSALFEEEIRALLENGDRSIQFRYFPISPDASHDDIIHVLEDIYTQTDIDIVLVLDLAANQFIGLQPSFEKPTFLPLVFNSDAWGYPVKNGSSGKVNLNYLSVEFNFTEELQRFRDIAQFHTVVFLSDHHIYQHISKRPVNNIITQSKDVGIDLSIIPIKASEIRTIKDTIPNNTDAIIFSAFPTFTTQETRQLIRDVNSMNIPSLALSGEDMVRMGVLATMMTQTDKKKIARRTAIHIQESIFGTAIDTLPVYFESTRRLMLNMETANDIGFVPTFDTLRDAVIINRGLGMPERRYSLNDVANIAVSENLALLAQMVSPRIAETSVNEAGSALLPQLHSSLQYLTRQKSLSTQSGFFAKNSNDLSLSLNQTIFSDQRFANHDIQRYLHLSEKEQLRELTLDTIQLALTRYLNVLLQKTALDQARYNLDITRSNYELAENRVKVGISNASDRLRWESELANAHQRVFSEEAAYASTRHALNRLLNRPIGEDFSVTDETLDNPAIMFVNDKTLLSMIESQRSLDALIHFYINMGIQKSPELAQIDAQLHALTREMSTEERQYWLPEFSASGTFTHNIDEDRSAAGLAAEDTDWQLALGMTLPLYEGGARDARLEETRLSIDQLMLRRKDTINRVEQDVRDAVASLGASYRSIEYADLAEDAAEKNYVLVSKSYAEGKEAILNVLDAQEALINAKEASINSIYRFITDVMILHRASRSFDFFLNEGKRASISNALKEHIQSVNDKKTVGETHAK